MGLHAHRREARVERAGAALRRGPGRRRQTVRGQRAEDRGQKRDRPEKRKKKKKPGKYDSRLWTWIEKYKAHREAQRKGGHTPGVWVLYFALAALPLFALGQSLIDADDDKRRRATFLQMAVYVASALALLVTTSLLGVRRYLRQRKAKVPAAMTASWLGLGGILIAAFLALGAFLPRPHSEVPWFGIERAGKSDREASKYAQLGDSAGKGEGRGGNQTKAGDGTASGKGGQPGGGNTGEKGGGGKGQSGKGGSGKKGDQSGGDQKGGGKGNGNDSEASKDREGGRGGEEAKDEGNDAKDNNGGRDSRPINSQPGSETFRKVAGAVKWVVFAIVAVLVVFGLFFGVLKYLAPFTDWARRWLEGIRAWWASLFGKANPDRKVGGAAEEAKPLGPAAAAVHRLLEPVRGRHRGGPRHCRTGRVHVRGTRRLGLGPRRRARAGRDPAGVRPAAGRSVSRSRGGVCQARIALHAHGLFGPPAAGHHDSRSGGSLGADGSAARWGHEW